MNDNVMRLERTRGLDDAADLIHTYRIPPGFDRFFRAWLSGDSQWILKVFEDRLYIALETDRHPNRVTFNTVIDRLRRCGWDTRIKQPCLLIMSNSNPAYQAVLECDQESANLTLCQSPDRFAQELVEINRYYPANKTSRSSTK